MNNFSDRDTAVIPWLPAYSSPSVAKAAPKRPCKLIKLLEARERIGLKSKCTRTGALTEGVLVSNDELSRAAAWNRRRMQNMILAVGPGTPASCVLTSVPLSSDSTGINDESESNDEDDIYNVDSDDEEDPEMLQSEEEDDGIEETAEYPAVAAAAAGGDDDDGEENADESEDNSDIEILAEGSAALSNKDNDLFGGSRNSDEDRAEAEEEISRHLAARPIKDESEERNSLDDRRSAWTLNQASIRHALAHLSSDQEENGSDSRNQNDYPGVNTSDESDENDSRADRAAQVLEFIDQQIRRQHRRRRRRSQFYSSNSNCDTQSSQQYKRQVARSMKHGGCINTASWLDCGWRISTVSNEDGPRYNGYYNDHVFTSSSYSSNESYSTPKRQKASDLSIPTSPSEYPTQLLTSGDDHVVKFWDVSQSMGSTSPLPGGSATITPFSSPTLPMKPTSELITKWRSRASTSDEVLDYIHRRHLPGIVHPLLTLSTGHRGNVFHVTPVPYNPGKVVTCAADGYLRMSDVELNATSSPAAVARGRSNSSSSNMVGETSAVIISPEYHSENGESRSFLFRENLMCFSHHFLNSNVGLVCSERGLLHFDLRLSPSSQKRGSLVEELSSTCKSCCVWKEYDEYSDSAYVFAGGSGNDVAMYDLRMIGRRPCSQAVQRYRPRPLRRKSSVSVSGIELSKDKKELLVAYESDQCYTFPVFPGASATGPMISDFNDSLKENINARKPIPELSQYGGHLNRLTFLKMAKYAGPNDEFICTGSDSGHAWIYDKHTGAVAAFLRADHSTCNGILPHPSLPYFITYGIDSTVKLWRATMPVDDETDDSDTGRFNYSQKEEYSKSIIVDKWKTARKRNPVDLDDEEISFFPDETPIEDVTEDSISLGFMGLLFSRARTGSNPPFIGNDLKNLQNEIKKNYYTCARTGIGEDVPVKSGLIGLKRRPSLIKLRHHADRLGLHWDSNVPWNFAFKNTFGESLSMADLIPDPSDWIPFHPLMTEPPFDSGTQFSKRHKQFYFESYADRSVHPVIRACIGNDDAIEECDEKKSESYDSSRAWDILYSTVSLLKEAGNDALQKSFNCLAARYYDRAILYCSLAYMEFPVGNSDFLVHHQTVLSENSGWECRWTSLLKTFIQIRLNMSLCCLKSNVNDTKAAVIQAKMALKELKPFVAKKGCVMTGKKLERTRLEEPESTYTEAMALQSKAYFRLGCAQLLLREFEEAIESYEQSIKSSSESNPDKKPDATVLRKLQEARLANRRHYKSERKKFKFAFATKEKDASNESDEGKESVS